MLTFILVLVVCIVLASVNAVQLKNFVPEEREVPVYDGSAFTRKIKTKPNYGGDQLAGLILLCFSVFASFSTMQHMNNRAQLVNFY
jgi:hypothetical protein